MKAILWGFFVAFVFVAPFVAEAQVPDEAFLPGEAEALYGDEAFVAQEPTVQSEDVKARVIEIESETEENGIRQIKFTAEDEKGERYHVDTSESLTEGLRYHIAIGDTVYLAVLRNTATQEVETAYLADVRRIPALMIITILFALLTVAVGLIRGFSALIGLAITFGVLFLFIFPQILAGHDAVLVTVIGSIVILAVNMHLSHGFNRGTLLAFSSTVIGLGLTYVLAKIFVGAADLSGLANEEAILLYYHQTEIIVPAGILLSGIILGAVGVLDDIAITQSETVAELREANPRLSRQELFVAAMRVGRHHIASTVNTLVLAYAGVAMPLILLFLVTPEITLARFINAEPVAEEIIRTLAGTMALVLTVPIATLFATFGRKR